MIKYSLYSEHKGTMKFLELRLLGEPNSEPFLQ